VATDTASSYTLDPDDRDLLETTLETVSAIKRSCAYLERALTSRLECEPPLPAEVRSALTLIAGGCSDA
jgi:hypothetical protein